MHRTSKKNGLVTSKLIMLLYTKIFKMGILWIVACETFDGCWFTCFPWIHRDFVNADLIVAHSWTMTGCSLVASALCFYFSLPSTRRVWIAPGYSSTVWWWNLRQHSTPFTSLSVGKCVPYKQWCVSNIRFIYIRHNSLLVLGSIIIVVNSYLFIFYFPHQYFRFT